MAPFDRILLCYDATPEGLRALRCGAALARRLGAEAHLLAVLDLAWWPAGYNAFSSMKFDIDENAAREILQEGIAKLQSWGGVRNGPFCGGRRSRTDFRSCKFPPRGPDRD